MDILNSNHDAIIHVYQKPIAKESTLKDGEITPHEQRVNKVSFLKERFADPIGSYWLKIEVDKKAILELAEQIKKIESEQVDAHYDNLPF